MRAPQTEIVDSKTADQFEDSVSGVGAIKTIVGVSVIRGGIVVNPQGGPNANVFGKYLRVSIDGQNNWATIGVGGHFKYCVTPVDNTVYIDAWLDSGVTGQVNYEAAVSYEDHSV